MYNNIRIFVTLAFIGLIKGQIFDPSKCQNFSANLIQCGQKYPVVDSEDALQALEYFRQSTSICNKMSEYKQLITCLVDATMNCLQDDFKTLTPPTTAYIEAFDDFCKNINVLNVSCYQEGTREIRQCLSKNTGRYQIPTNSSFDDKKTFVCKAQEVVVGCHSNSTVLNACPGTRDMVLKNAEILKPPACGAMMIISSIMLLVLSMMLFVSTVY